MTLSKNIRIDLSIDLSLFNLRCFTRLWDLYFICLADLGAPASSCVTTALGELQLGVFAEPRGIGVKQSAGVAKRLEDEFGRRDLGGQLRALLAGCADAKF